MTDLTVNDTEPASNAHPTTIDVHSDASSDLSDAPPPSEDEKTLTPSTVSSSKGDQAVKGRKATAIAVQEKNGKVVIADDDDSSEEEQYLARDARSGEEDSEREGKEVTNSQTGKKKRESQMTQQSPKKQKRTVGHGKAKDAALYPEVQRTALCPDKKRTTMPSDKKPQKPIAPKGAWVQSLPQACAVPPDSSDRKTISNDDILYTFHKLLTNFLAWKPQPVPSDLSASASASTSASTSLGLVTSPDGSTAHIGENRYNYLERCCGITHRHKYGWGEYMRAPFAGFVSRVFKWVQSGGQDRGALEGLSTKVEGVDWTVVLESWWAIEEIRPAWKDIQVERCLVKGGNEMVRLRFGTVFRKLCAELGAIAEKQKAAE